MTPKLVEPSWTERLKAAGAAVKDADDARALALRHRDELIVQAVDERALSQRQIAKAAGVTVGVVCKALARSQDDAA